MSDPYENAALVELLGSISDRRIRRRVKKLLQYGAEAVRSLGELDSALYTRGNGEEQLQVVSDAVLSHVRRLLEYLGGITATLASEESGDSDIDIDFAVGDSLDLTDAIASMQSNAANTSKTVQPTTEKTDQDKWRDLTIEMDSMQYGLSSELKDLDRRFSEALRQDRKQQALRELNDATDSLIDGVFALMTSAYEEFLGYSDPDRMIPGYRDTLGKTLALRRGLTELRREVQELNRAIQDPQSNATVAEMSYKLLVSSLIAFINAEVYSYLRPDDKREFEDFCERLLEGDPAKSSTDCEGLDKYLDSLAVVSQRDVLMKHDADLRQTIREKLEAAQALAGAGSEGAPAMVAQAFEKADRLFGLIDELDSVVYTWSTLRPEEKGDLQQALQMGRRLQSFLEPRQLG